MPKPNMKKLFTGRGKTRPIPRIVDSSDITAAKIVATQQPRTGPAEKAFGSRVNAGPVLGTKIAGTGRAGQYNPTGTDHNV